MINFFAGIFFGFVTGYAVFDFTLKPYKDVINRVVWTSDLCGEHHGAKDLRVSIWSDDYEAVCHDGTRVSERGVAKVYLKKGDKVVPVTLPGG